MSTASAQEPRYDPPYSTCADEESSDAQPLPILRLAAGRAAGPPAPQGAQISAVTWIFIAVGAVLLGVVAVVVLWRSRGSNPFAIAQAMQVLEGVGDAVGTASHKVQQVSADS